MNARRGTSRRAFLGLLAGLLLGGIAGGPWRRGGHLADGLAEVPGLGFSGTGRTGAAVLGRAYLRQAPHERDRRALLGHLSDDRPEGLSMADLRARVRSDFERGATVSVEGWVLSLTEVRVYALIALS